MAENYIQDQSLMSIPRQIKEIKRFAQSRGWVVVDVLTDGQGGEAPHQHPEGA